MGVVQYESVYTRAKSEVGKVYPKAPMMLSHLYHFEFSEPGEGIGDPTICRDAFSKNLVLDAT